MQYMKIKQMTDDAIKTASAEGRLFRRVRSNKSMPLKVKPFELHKPGCKCTSDGGDYWPDCMNTINIARAAIKKGNLFLGVK